MAKIIAFYVPNSFSRKTKKWIPSEQYGRLIRFDSHKRSRPNGSAASAPMHSPS